ncbi:hypothetical protein LJR231_002659 [Phyllobacterium sp. LjRoot231]|uniref:hypothetical protein n=1 Tax=Phyllobacterium sp. LjRoot231 TaxID=3342289 RepID=UPI003ECFDF80
MPKSRCERMFLDPSDRSVVQRLKNVDESRTRRPLDLEIRDMERPRVGQLQRKARPRQDVRIEIEQAGAISCKRVAEEWHADAAHDAARMIGMPGCLGAD